MSGGGEHQLDGAQRFLLDALNAQMQRLLRENNEELYERIERLENRERHEEERRGGNGGGPRPNRIEGVKLNIPPFKGKSDPEAYLEWELKIEHIFSCNTYEEAQKLKLAAANSQIMLLCGGTNCKGRELEMRSLWWKLGLR